MENQNLMTLSHFAFKARKEMGRIKVTDLMTDRNYATNLLIQSYFSRDHELIELAKKASNALDLTLMHAIEKYVEFIVKKRQKINILIIKDYLIKFAGNLDQVDGDGHSYRKAVNHFLTTVKEEERKFCINLARDFYPFWIEVVNSVVCSGKSHLFNLITLNKEPKHKMLLNIWNDIESESLTDIENIPLNRYKQLMIEIGMSQKVIATRLKIAKIIIFELRHHHDEFDMNYRNAVTKTQHLFKVMDVKRVFICVSREFYYFCIGHPDAANFILYHERLAEAI